MKFKELQTPNLFLAPKSHHFSFLQQFLIQTGTSTDFTSFYSIHTRLNKITLLKTTFGSMEQHNKTVKEIEIHFYDLYKKIIV